MGKRGLLSLESPIGRFIPLNPRDGAELALPGTPSSRLAAGKAPFRRMAFSVGGDERAGCARLPSLLS